MRVSQESLTAGTRGGRQLSGTLSHVVRGRGISPQAVRQLLCPHKDGLFVTAKLRRGSEKYRANERENERERWRLHMQVGFYQKRFFFYYMKVTLKHS